MNQHAEDLRKCCDALQAEIQRLREQAAEIANEGHAGWGNTMSVAADKLASLRAERDALRARIEGAPVVRLHKSAVLDDTSVHLCDHGGDSIDVSAFDDRQVRLVVEE